MIHGLANENRTFHPPIQVIRPSRDPLPVGADPEPILAAAAPDAPVPIFRLVAFVAVIFAFGALGPVVSAVRARAIETSTAHSAGVTIASASIR